MSNEIITWLKAELVKFEGEAAPAVAVVEADVEAAGSATFNYIKTNGLSDLYQAALAIVAGFATGTPWGVVLAAVEAQAVTDGKQLLDGASAIIAGQAQSDLIAVGKLIAPTAAPAA